MVDMTFEYARHGCGGACGGRWGRARRVECDVLSVAHLRQSSSKKEATICPRGGPDMVWANDGDDERVRWSRFRSCWTPCLPFELRGMCGRQPYSSALGTLITFTPAQTPATTLQQ
jgi:hypothetical protein